jgi:hypothetical protein
LIDQSAKNSFRLIACAFEGEAAHMKRWSKAMTRGRTEWQCRDISLWTSALFPDIFKSLESEKSPE